MLVQEVASEDPLVTFFNLHRRSRGGKIPQRYLGRKNGRRRTQAEARNEFRQMFRARRAELIRLAVARREMRRASQKFARECAQGIVPERRRLCDFLEAKAQVIVFA